MHAYRDDPEEAVRFRPESWVESIGAKAARALHSALTDSTQNQVHPRDRVVSSTKSENRVRVITKP